MEYQKTIFTQKQGGEILGVIWAVFVEPQHMTSAALEHWNSVYVQPINAPTEYHAYMTGEVLSSNSNDFEIFKGCEG